MNPDLEEEFELLLIDYEDGSITPEGVTRMRELMKEHEAFRKLYVQQQLLHGVSSQLDLKALSLPPIQPLKKKSNITRLVWAGIAALIALSCLGIFYFQQSESPKVIAELASDQKFAKVWRKGQLIKTDRFCLGDKFITNERKLSIRYLGESTIIIFKEETEATLGEEDGAKRIYLKSGSLICDVDKQPKDKPMVIYTDEATTTILGTQFLLNSENDQTHLQVSEGLVHFKDKQSSKMVAAKAGFKAHTDRTKGIQLMPYNVSKNIVVTDLVFIDPISETPHFSSANLVDGMIIDRKDMKSEYINILLDSDKSYVGGVFFTFDVTNLQGKKVKVINEKDQRKNKSQETIYPYYVVGDGLDDREEKPCKWKAVPGHYELTYTPFGKNKKGLGQKNTIQFEIR